MSGLVDRHGRPISSSMFKKADPPKMGEIGNLWAGRDLSYMQLPGGTMLQFDLTKLTINDYRAMRDHYQVNANQMVLQFMMHRLDWKIECSDSKIRSRIEEQLREVWPRLIRGISQAYWAGYAPNILEYENAEDGSGKVVLNKVKDLVPEECLVNWKFVDAWAPPGSHSKPKVKIFDGIKVWGMQWPVPVENSFWYPLLMENGNYYGKKLLRPAFPSWYFSILLHLFANRYYERFGEPVPIGRAPEGDTLTIGGKSMDSRAAMEMILTQLRSRAVVVLPSDRSQIGTGNQSAYDYEIEYLESQMRGADFERYMTRLDEEISLSLFTPILLLRTADVGSYNLGVGHMQLFMWMLNALAGDLKEYIDRYIVRPIKNFNFGPNAAEAYWVPAEMGKQNVETMRAVVTALMSGGGAKPDLEELSSIIGLDLKEVPKSEQPAPTPPGADPNNPEPVTPGNDPRQRDRGKGTGPKGVGQTRSTTKDVSARIQEQVLAAYKKGKVGPDWVPSMGFTGKLQEALKADGFHDYSDRAQAFTASMNEMLQGITQSGPSDPEEYMRYVNAALENEVESLASG